MNFDEIGLGWLGTVSWELGGETNGDFEEGVFQAGLF
jgi:hypothetical protein